MNDKFVKEYASVLESDVRTRLDGKQQVTPAMIKAAFLESVKTLESRTVLEDVERRIRLLKAMLPK